MNPLRNFLLPASLLILYPRVNAQFSFDTTKFKIDTSTPPDNEVTGKIKEIRKERGAFDIQTFAVLKIKEQQSKDTSLPKEYYDRFLSEFKDGDANRIPENTMINFTDNFLQNRRLMIF